MPLNLFQGEFYKNVGKLMFSAIGAQGLQLLALIFLFEPIFGFANIGLFMVHFSVVSISLILVRSSYQAAIMVTKSHEESISMVQLANGFVLLLALLGSLFVLIAFNIPYVVEKLDIQSSSFIHAGLMFVAICCTGVANNWRMWHNYNKNYSKMARAHFIMALVNIIVTTSLGYLSFLELGLFMGYIAGHFARTVILYEKTLWQYGLQDWSVYKDLMTRYNDFFKLGGLSEFINLISKQLPLLSLPFLFNSAVNGQYGMADKILGAPIVFVSSNLSTVYLQEISEAYRSNRTLIKQYTHRILKIVLSLAVLMVVSVWVFSLFFDFLVPEKWQQTLLFLKWLVFWAALLFINNPISNLADVYRKLHYQVYYTVAVFVVQISIFFAVWYWNLSAINFIKAYALLGTLITCCYCLFLYKNTVGKEI